MNPPARELRRLPPDVRRFLEVPRLASVATINPDGSPHQAVVWYLVEDDAIVINSAEGRRWPTNLRRDPRVGISVADDVHWVGLRGSVEVIDDREQAQADIAAMAYRYDGPEAARDVIEGQFRRELRVSFRLRPTSIHVE